MDDVTYHIDHSKLAVVVNSRAVRSKPNSQALVHAFTQIILRELGYEGVVVDEVLRVVCSAGNMVLQDTP